MNIEDFAVRGSNVFGVVLSCPLDPCPQPWIEGGGTIRSAIEAAKEHMVRYHYAEAVSQAFHDSTRRSLDEADGIHYAHLNGLDCGRRPCSLCHPEW